MPANVIRTSIGGGLNVTDCILAETTVVSRSSVLDETGPSVMILLLDDV